MKGREYNVYRMEFYVSMGEKYEWILGFCGMILVFYYIILLIKIWNLFLVLGIDWRRIVEFYRIVKIIFIIWEKLGDVMNIGNILYFLESFYEILNRLGNMILWNL